MGTCFPLGKKATNGLTLHFAGLKAPKSCKSTLHLIDTISIITIDSFLKINNTILNLKQLIRKTYQISSHKDVLIIYANNIISKNDELTLHHFNITNNSLLLLAIKAESDQYKSYISSIPCANTPSSSNTPPFRFVADRLIRTRTQLTDLDFEFSPPPFICNRSRMTPIQSPQFRTPRLIHNIHVINDDSDFDTDTTESDDEEIHIERYRNIHRNIHRNILVPTTPLPQESMHTLHRRRNASMSLFSIAAMEQITETMHLQSPSPRVNNNNFSFPGIPTLQLNDTETCPMISEKVRNICPIQESPIVTDDIKTESSLTVSSVDKETDIDWMKPQKGFDIITRERNVLLYKMPICGHLMNRESLYEYILSKFMDRNNIDIKCPHLINEHKASDDALWRCDRCTFDNKNNIKHCVMCGGEKNEIKMFCDADWEYSEIKKLFTQNNIVFDDNKLCKFELFASRNVLENECNAQQCLECDSLYFRENLSDDNKWMKHKINNDDLPKVFKTKCNFCVNTSFCWKCGEKWGNQHFCDSSFRMELIKILQNAETKKIGDVDNVPSIRCCPKCCQLINHSEACKHMQCRECKTDFCFVCLKQKIGGEWQCGSHSDTCTVAQRQTAKTLPDSVFMHKKAFKLF